MNFGNICNHPFIITKTASKRAIKEAADITLIASLTPVCLTTPLYEPINIKQAKDNTSTKGSCKYKSTIRKLKVKLKRTRYAKTKVSNTKTQSINSTSQREAY